MLRPLFVNLILGGLSWLSLPARAGDLEEYIRRLEAWPQVVTIERDVLSNVKTVVFRDALGKEIVVAFDYLDRGDEVEITLRDDSEILNEVRLIKPSQVEAISNLVLPRVETVTELLAPKEYRNVLASPETRVESLISDAVGLVVQANLVYKRERFSIKLAHETKHGESWPYKYMFCQAISDDCLGLMLMFERELFDDVSLLLKEKINAFEQAKINIWQEANTEQVHSLTVLPDPDFLSGGGIYYRFRILYQIFNQSIFIVDFSFSEASESVGSDNGVQQLDKLSIVGVNILKDKVFITFSEGIVEFAPIGSPAFGFQRRGENQPKPYFLVQRETVPMPSLPAESLIWLGGSPASFSFARYSGMLRSLGDNSKFCWSGF